MRSGLCTRAPLAICSRPRRTELTASLLRKSQVTAEGACIVSTGSRNPADPWPRQAHIEAEGGCSVLHKGKCCGVNYGASRCRRLMEATLALVPAATVIVDCVVAFSRASVQATQAIFAREYSPGRQDALLGPIGLQATALQAIGLQAIGAGQPFLALDLAPGRPTDLQRSVDPALTVWLWFLQRPCRAVAQSS